MLNKYLNNEFFLLLKNHPLLVPLCFSMIIPCPNIFFNNTYVFHTYTFALLCIFYIVFYFLIDHNYKIQITSITFLTILLLLFFILRNIHTLGPHHIGWISCILFFLLVPLNCISKDDICKTLKLLCIFELVICAWQITTHPNLFFYTTGTFDNPTGLSILFSISIPFLLDNFHKKKDFSCPAIIILMTFTLILCGERKGLLIVLVALGVYLKKHNFPCRKLSFFFTIGILCFILLYSIYSPQSSYGRLFILYGSIVLCKYTPLLGNGIYAFNTKYMPWQADYLSKRMHTENAMLADNIVHSQNELLNLILENGCVILLFIVPLAWHFFKSMRLNRTVWHDCILSISLLSLLTYSFHFYIVTFMTILCLSHIKSKKIMDIPLTIRMKAITSIIIASFLYINIQGILFEYNWKKLSTNYLTSYIINLSVYEKLNELKQQWNGNPYFFYEYASISRNILDYKKSIESLTIYNKYHIDYDSYMMLGNNYYDLKDYDNANFFYLSAHQMCPNRFLPLRGLLRTAKKYNDKLKTKSIALEILNKPEKIKSFTTKSIKHEAELTIND